MKIKVKDIQINYIQYGKGKDILLLHGWGQNIEMMKPIGDNLSDKYRITIIDFPGFGKSDEPKNAWMIDDYKEMLEEIVKELKIKKPILMGLFGSPCIRKQKSMSLKTRVLKKMKTLPGMNGIGEKMKKYIGSRDYKAASPIMRQILVNTVNEDLSMYAKKIKVPTLLIWGDNDTEAPLEEAQELEKLMIDAGLVVLPGSHYAYLENLHQVINIVNTFLEGGN